MKVVQIYQCKSNLIFSQQQKQESGFLIETMSMFSISKLEEINEIQKTLIKALDHLIKEETLNQYTTSKYNKKLSKLCQCKNYKEVVSKSSIVTVVSKSDQIILVPLQRARSFIGFEGYNNLAETLSENSLHDGKVLSRILELLEEVIQSYDIS